jgi:hypothetical protein
MNLILSLSKMISSLLGKFLFNHWIKNSKPTLNQFTLSDKMNGQWPLDLMVLKLTPIYLIDEQTY